MQNCSLPVRPVSIFAVSVSPGSIFPGSIFPCPFSLYSLLRIIEVSIDGAGWLNINWVGDCNTCFANCCIHIVDIGVETLGQKSSNLSVIKRCFVSSTSEVLTLNFVANTLDFIVNGAGWCYGYVAHSESSPVLCTFEVVLVAVINEFNPTSLSFLHCPDSVLCKDTF